MKGLDRLTRVFDLRSSTTQADRTSSLTTSFMGNDIFYPVLIWDRLCKSNSYLKH